PSNYKHAGDRNPPAGALVFFQGRTYGHVAISTGGANIISTDIGGSGTLTRSTIGTIERKWGQKYVDWTAPYYRWIVQGRSNWQSAGMAVLSKDSS
ncbi:hypothetical protein BGX26_007277, partial [Mortierella sp. AD094]